MLHLFKINNDRLAFDTESFALHMADDASFHVLQAYCAEDGQKPGQAAIDQLRAEFGTDADDCIREIDSLVSEGKLFYPSKSIRVENLYPDVPRIKAMCLHVSHDCNLRCRYCFAGTGDFGTGERGMLDLKTGIRAVDFLMQASGPRKNLDIDFFGGEPLMNWPVVVALTEYCEKRSAETGKEIRLTITTNAILLNDEKTEFINQHFKNCVLSIDGRPEVHDRMRPDVAGSGSYSRVAGKIRRFAAARGEKEYYIRGTYTRHNLDFAEDVLHLAGLADQISVEPVVAPNGCGYEIRPEDVPVIEKEYERLVRLMADDRQIQNGKQPFNFFHFMIDLDEGPCIFKRLKGCGAGTEYCAVTPSGDIYPCHQLVGLSQFKMGNVTDQPVCIDSAAAEPFRHLLVPVKAACQNCWARYFCGGGCAASAFYASGRVDGLYETGCALQKKRLECSLWLKAKTMSDETDG